MRPRSALLFGLLFVFSAALLSVWSTTTIAQPYIPQSQTVVQSQQILPADYTYIPQHTVTKEDNFLLGLSVLYAIIGGNLIGYAGYKVQES